MTPAILQAEALGLDFTVHEFEPAGDVRFGARASEALGVPPDRVFKTLVAKLEGPLRTKLEGSFGAKLEGSFGAKLEGSFGAKLEGSLLVVAVVPVSAQLDLKLLAAASGAKRAQMAPPREAERATGYVLGGISPLGQRRRLPTFVDASALGFERIYVSGGRRGVEVELAPEALLRACEARAVRLVR